MVKAIIFDLSEVLIAGLFGIEKPLSDLVDVPQEIILPAFAGERLWQLCAGNLTEDAYLSEILLHEHWKIDMEEVKKIIRQNFHQKIPGTEQILMGFLGKYRLALMSDHAKEWINYIENIHPFLQLFDDKFFSYELKSTKHSQESFIYVLDALRCKPDECLFIDDSLKNVQTAMAVGMIGIQFTNAAELTKRLVEYGL